MARVCLLFLCGLALLCWLGPLCIGFDPHRPDWDALSVAPGTAGHWFGTDAIGRDVLARTLAGGRLSLTIGLLASLVATLPPSAQWASFGIGRLQMPMVAQSVMLGGHVRVGLEDSLWIGPGQFAKSNAEQVRLIRSIIESLSLEVATPEEARAELALKGGDKVAF